MKLIIIIISLLAALLIFAIIDNCLSYPISYEGIVVDKHYKAETTSTSVGVMSANNGASGTVVTSETSPEAFLIMVRLPSGDIITTNCTSKLYYQKQVGDSVIGNYNIGKFTGCYWSIETIK